MTAVEAICERLSLNELEELNRNLRNNGKATFLKAVKENAKREEEERLAVLNAAKQKNNLENKNLAVVKVAPEWERGQYPTRWEVVSNFINQHGTFTENSSKFNAKLVLAKAKDLQSADFSKNNLKEVANKQAFDNFKKDKKNVLNIDETGISKKLDSESITVNSDAKPAGGVKKVTSNGDIRATAKAEIPWTTSEQQLLEQALKTYPASSPERWDRIAECIPNRTKKECMKRYKELVETVKAKKAAQAAVASK
ncbi:hypothetical protein NQ318_003897 [Aromia moschata]|uniref:DnaJ homolog subfamily C member 2 n=1 Tax=Aromia moschata TaxID=1265417 RepID=A0AAV8Z8I4_9CUCU|nr:hypothetical protein NQ318_003897 [Aromia moschata]